MKNAPPKQTQPPQANKLLEFESKAKSRGFLHIAGIDEVGRGPLAGPVVACACVIPDGHVFPGINDSKLLTPLRRKLLFEALTHHPLVLYGIGQVEHDVIDKINIYEATKLAMASALDALKITPDYLLIDAVPLDYKGIPFENIIEGDRKSQSIAAASIIAKERRDALMIEYHKQYPQYGFDAHKGYGTKVHLEALKQHGPSPIHRTSFKWDKSLSD